MPILAQDIQDAMFSALDTTESDGYWTFDADTKFAINYAARKLLEWASTHQGSTRFNAEAIRDLRRILIYQTSAYSRIQLPDYLNTLEAVYPRPETAPSSPDLIALGDPAVSIIRNDIVFLNMVWDAQRKSREESSEARFNPFEAGYDHETIDDTLIDYAFWEVGDFASAAYQGKIKFSWDLGAMPATIVGDKISFTTNIGTSTFTLTAPLYTPDDVAAFITSNVGMSDAHWIVGAGDTIYITINGSFSSPSGTFGSLVFKHSDNSSFYVAPVSISKVDNIQEIQISPAIPSSYCAISIIKEYPAVENENDYVKMPTQMFNLIVELGLWWLSFKEGDNTSINGLSEKDIFSSIKNYGLDSE